MGAFAVHGVRRVWAPQIEQFLVAKRNKDAADAELARLRAVAKIEYLNKDLVPDAMHYVTATGEGMSEEEYARGYPQTYARIWQAMYKAKS